MPSSFFEWIVFLLKEYYPLFLKGVGVTLAVSITGTVIGFVIGLGIAMLRTIPDKRGRGGHLTAGSRFAQLGISLVKWICSAYVEVFRGTPMMVQAMVIYYGGLAGLLSDLGDVAKGIVSAIIIISINTGAYMAEIIRGGIISVDKGQTEGAMSIGMTHWQTMVGVVFPQAVRNIMPSIGNEFVVNIKDSSVLNVIAVAELFFSAKSAAGTYLRYFEVFFIVAVIYFVLTFTVTRLLRLVEKHMDGPDHYVILGSQSEAAPVEKK